MFGCETQFSNKCQSNTREFRYPTEISVGMHDDQKYDNYTSFDIGRGGIFLQMERPLKIGKECLLFIELEEKIFEVIAIVRWGREVGNSSGPAGAGLEFVEIENDYSQALERFISDWENHFSWTTVA